MLAFLPPQRRAEIVAEAHRVMDLLEAVLADQQRLQVAAAERRARAVLAEQLPLLEGWAGVKVRGRWGGTG